MEDTLLKELGTSIRKSIPCTFVGTESPLLDAGPGFSFVAIDDEELDACTLTVRGKCGDDIDPVEEVLESGDMMPVMTADDETVAYTIAISGNGGIIPLDIPTMNPIRFIALDSSVDVDGATINLIAKPV